MDLSGIPEIVGGVVAGGGIAGVVIALINTRHSRADKRDERYDSFTKRVEEAHAKVTRELAECQENCLNCQKEHLDTLQLLGAANTRIDTQDDLILNLKDQMDSIEKATGVAERNGERLAHLEELIERISKDGRELDKS